MAVRPILLLGDPRLYDVATDVQPQEVANLNKVIEDLQDTLLNFRARTGSGRAIAAPQIGVAKKLIYVHIDRPWVIFNPVLGDKSADRIELWDDCLSFPELLVKVERHSRCSLSYRNLDWQEQQMELTGALAELLQHECDHLSGILAVERMIDRRSFAWRKPKGGPQ